MTINICEDCDLEVKCASCHSDCPNCGGEIKKVDYVEYKLGKHGNNNKA